MYKQKGYNLKEISVEITNKCDLKCIHCSSDSGKALDNELSLEEIFNVIEQAKELGANILTISGGEPLLRDDLMSIINYGRKNNFEVRLQTSGTYYIDNRFTSIPEKFLDDFEKGMSEKDSIIYSILGTKREHERTTSIEHSYLPVFDSIRKTKSRNIKTGVHTVVTNLNYENLKTIFGILEQEKVDYWHLLRLIKQGRCGFNPELKMSKENFMSLQTHLVDISNKKMGMEIIVGNNVDWRCLIDDSYPVKRCIIGEEKILVRPNGEITYCAGIKNHNYGNIRDKSLDYFWNESPEIIKLRGFIESGFKDMDSKCKSCNIQKKCRGGCIAQKMQDCGDIYKRDPMCFREK